jgi:hypothetical protein
VFLPPGLPILVMLFVQNGCCCLCKPVLNPESTTPPSELESLLQEFSDVLSGLPERLPPSRKQDHFIRLLPDTDPPISKLYPLSSAQLLELREQLRELLDRGYMRPWESPYGAPILFVPKHDGGWRMCVFVLTCLFGVQR